MVYTLRFFSLFKMQLFHNSNVFGSCIIHILYTGCAKIKKKSGVKRLTANRYLAGFFFLILRQPVYKILIIQEPNMLEL